MSGGLAAALLAFHQDAQELELVKTAAGVHSTYLPLDELMAKVRPLLVKHGLVLIQTPTTLRVDGTALVPALRTRLVHAGSGEAIEDTMLLDPAKRDPQGQGSALTYARRYSAMAFLALVADRDDDGEPAQRRKRQPSGKINAAQRNELMTAVRAAGITTERASEIIKVVAGVEKSTDIPAEKVADVMKAIRAEKP